jgi:hypothetical protein
MNVETVQLLEDLQEFIRRYVVLTADQGLAVTLWTVHTHAVEVLGITPYLSITSAEKQSGKTHLLEVLELVVANPWLTGSVSAATLARKVQQRPTLLLDESDAAFKGDSEYAETLRGVLNSGFKVSGVYSRCVGASGTSLKVEDFSTFCAKAIAGIGSLPDTVRDRSILIRMQRKTANETVVRKRERTIRRESEPLRERIAAWAESHADQLAQLDLAPLEELPDRQADIWEPLVGIAHLAGEAWFSRARIAARRLQPDSDDSIGVRLLSDLRDAFDRHGDKLFSETAVDFLNAIEEAPWPEWRGKPLTKNGLASLLKRFEIRPHSVRIGDETLKGYERQTFEPIFTRYLPTLPNETSQRHIELSMRDSGDFKPSQTESGVTFQNGRDPISHAGCDVVTVQTGGASETELGEDAITELGLVSLGELQERFGRT